MNTKNKDREVLLKGNGGRKLAAAALLPFLLGAVGSSLLEAQSIESLRGPIRSLAALPADNCYTFQLLEEGSEFLKRHRVPASLGWTTSGIWRGSELLLADLTTERVVKVAAGGLVRPGIAALPFANTERDEKIVAPWYISPRDDGGFLLLDLQDTNNRILFVNPHGKVDAIMPTEGRVLHDEKRGEITVTGVFRMAAMSNGALVSADFRDNTEEKWSSFAYLDIEDDAYHPFEAGLSEDFEDLMEKFYSRDLSYMTVIDDVGYILMMEEEPWIGRVELTSSQIRPLKHFPSDLRVPGLQVRREFSVPEEIIEWLHEIYRTIETHRMPAGLVSWHDRLFVLIKSAADPRNGHTSWHLIEVSKEDGRDLGYRMELPTQAEHIALVAGSEFFAVIEKGGIEFLDAFPQLVLYRSVGSAVLFPESWISEQETAALRKGLACQPIEVESND